MTYPLRFKPIFRRYIWGGRRLHEILNKPIGDETCAESWEVVDHDQDQSIVEYGELQGRTLGSLVSEYGAELLGEFVADQITDPKLPPHLQNRFPLLLKFLDASRDLSVQVHPNDSFGATLSPPDLGKTEAWYVIDAQPGAKIYAGLRAGVTQVEFARAIETGQTADLLHRFEPVRGDSVLVRAGTLHAIGAGLLIAEIQQASDTTFRVFDWNRVDANGTGRELHVEQALATIDFNLGPVGSSRPERCAETGSEVLVQCEKFIMKRWSISEPMEVGDRDCFRILAVTNGAARIEHDTSGLPLTTGQSILLPASLGAVGIQPIGRAELLEIFIPGSNRSAL